MPEPDPSFYEEFTEPVKASLVEALTTAYNSACSMHDPAIGCNDMTFGYNLYHFIVFEVRGASGSQEPQLFQTTYSNQTFRVQVGSYELAVHRVGQTAQDDIWTSFPNNDKAVTTMVNAPYLPGLEPDLQSSRSVVLAHMGNPEDGLCAAYLCFATRQSNDRISEWGFALPILETGTGTIVPPDDGPLVPEEAIDPVQVRLRGRSRETGAQ